MKRLIQIIVIGVIFTCISFSMNAQTRHIYLRISQPNAEECITGIENTFKNCDFKIFPNPSNGLFTLEIINRSLEVQTDLSIYDSAGKEVFNQPLRINEELSKTIDLSGYKPGTYFLTVKGGKGAVFKANLMIY